MVCNYFYTLFNFQACLVYLVPLGLPVVPEGVEVTYPGQATLHLWMGAEHLWPMGTGRLPVTG